MLAMKQQAPLESSGSLAGFERVASGLLRFAATGLVLVGLAGSISCGDDLGGSSDFGGPSDPRGPSDPSDPNDPAGSTTGKLQVSTSQAGQHFDQDGYLLTINGVDSLHLEPGETAEVELAPGLYSLRLLGVADNCWVAETWSEIDIAAGRTVSVIWTVSCRAPTTSGVLAFESRGNIYITDLEGSSLRRLTSRDSPRSYNREAAWSPNGRQIAFSGLDDQSGATIYVAYLDGRDTRRLSPAGTFDAAPTWSPNGRRIAFEGRDREGNGHIFAMNADGTNRVQLTTNRQPNSSPAWSPDGQRIAYVTYSDIAPAEGTHIYIMNTDGTNNVPLTRGVAEDNYPAWSPDGKRIVFIRSGNLFVMNADGTSPVPLTLTRDAYDPAWSPDGSMIAMNRFTDCRLDPYGEADCKIGIWVVPASGGRVHELPLGPRYWYPSGPSWRP